MTKRTVENLAGLNKKFKTRVESFLVEIAPILEENKVSIEVLSGLRSWQQQASLYASGRTRPGPILTKARPGSSWHNYGLAVDFGLFAGGKYLDQSAPTRAAKIYKQIAAAWMKNGGEWAGTWKSFPEDCHFQWTNGKTLSQLRWLLLVTT
jgi:peptidoglycan L-alanyl-D-glutamate endopeptidase CwlK